MIQRDIVIEKTSAFLVDELGLEAEHLTPQTALFSSKLLDSMNVLSLIIFLETTFQVKIPTFEVGLETFDTMDSISDYLEKKHG